MADGQGTGRWVLTGECHELGEGLRREGRRRARAGLIGEEGFDEPEQLGVGGPFRLGRGEAVLALGPALAPGPCRLPMEVELMSDRIIGQTIGGKANDLDATEQLLGGVLPSRQMIQQGALAKCHLDGKRTRAGHPRASFRGRIRLSEPKFISSSCWRWNSAAMY
jgi:hypothetical protein